MTILEQPLDAADLQEIYDETGATRVTANFAVALDDLFDAYDKLRFLSRVATGTDQLRDISYKVVGHEDAATLVLEISGDAARLLK